MFMSNMQTQFFILSPASFFSSKLFFKKIHTVLHIKSTMSTSTNNTSDDDDNDSDKPSSSSLPKLLAALALGARSVNALPLVNNSEGDGDDDVQDGDEISFLMSLPEFATLNNEAQQSVTSLLCQALAVIPSDDDDDDTYTDNNSTETKYEFDDPELWEQCANACDALYDRVMNYINENTNESQQQQQSSGENNNNNYESLTMAITNVSAQSRTNSYNSYNRMVNSLASMEKPQNVYQGFVTFPPQNGRDEPFIPVIVYDGNKQIKLDGGEYTRDGHGLDTRTTSYSHGSGEGEGEEKRDVTRRKYSSDMIAPTYHYDHPYSDEIDILEYRPWQLNVDNIQPKDAKQIANDNKNNEDDVDGVWIDNEDDLEKLCKRITEGQEEDGDVMCEIALDLEAHSHRTFAGFVCLIQLSLRRPRKKRKLSSLAAAKAQQEQQSSTTTASSSNDVSTGFDFVIDALALRHAIPTHLGPILVNPNILKVMHGADSDIPWLQRDFGCYVVNLFDTGRAARLLKYPSAGLAYLLRKYVNIEADKVHQLSDWRRRPLPDDMRRYAVSDTKYLLDIYDQLRLELDNHTMDDVSIVSVLDRSKQVCLIRYDKEAFIPSGYKTIMDGGRNATRKNNSKVMTELSSQQEAALRALYDWRDRTARQEDESVQYVCSNAALLRIASNRPATVATLQRLVNPLPPLVMRRSQEILDAISTAVAVSEKSKEEEEDVSVKKTTASTGKPTNTTVQQPPEVRRREMLSPILGSEALYQQAGWMTPTLSGGNASSSGTSDESDDEEITKFLDVTDENQGYAATLYSSHSIEMSPPLLENDTAASRDGKRSNRTDGLGTARAGAADGSSVEEDVRVAQRSSALIQKEMVSGKEGGGKFGNGFSLIDLIRPVAMTEHVDLDKEQTEETNEDSAADNNVPEVAPEEDEMTIPKSMKEIYHLSNANRVRGKEKPSLQFPPNDNDAKEVRKMKEDDVDQADAILSRGGGYFTNTSKRQRTTPGKEGDIKLMTKLGWVKDKKDAESLAVVSGNSGDPPQPAVHGPPQKKSSVNRSSAGSQSLFDNSPTSNYYSNMGGGASSVGAYDPNAAPSNNPFFSGAATSAASMLHGGGDSEGKSTNKKNRHRGRR